MLDTDLATLYEVETKVLIQAMRRNIERFSEDFMFQLSKHEFDHLKSQPVTSSWGGRRAIHRMFLPSRVAMLSSVLRSKRAVQINIEIMRAFVRLREILASNKKMERQLRDMKQKYGKKLKIVFDAIHQLMMPPDNTKKRPVGFIWNDEEKITRPC